MKNELKFEKLVALLKRYPNILYSAECLNDIELGDIQVKNFSDPFMRINQIDVYKKRYKTQNLEGKERFIFGLFETINYLEAYNGDIISISKIANQKKLYTVLTDAKYDTLIGLFFNTKMNIQDLLSLEEKYIDQGYSQIDRWYTPDIY